MSKAKFENVDVKNGDEIPILDISYASLIHVDIGNKKLAKLGEDLHKVKQKLHMYYWKLKYLTVHDC